MSVLDTSALVDFLLGDGVALDVLDIIEREGVAAAPDLVVFEVFAVLRRDVARGGLSVRRAAGAIEDLDDFPLVLYPTMALRGRAWALRDNLTAADALFVTLAERLDESLVTKDAGLVAAARQHAGIDVIHLTSSEEA